MSALYSHETLPGSSGQRVTNTGDKRQQQFCILRSQSLSHVVDLGPLAKGLKGSISLGVSVNH